MLQMPVQPVSEYIGEFITLGLCHDVIGLEEAFEAGGHFLLCSLIALYKSHILHHLLHCQSSPTLISPSDLKSLESHELFSSAFPSGWQYLAKRFQGLTIP